MHVRIAMDTVNSMVKAQKEQAWGRGGSMGKQQQQRTSVIHSSIKIKN